MLQAQLAQALTTGPLGNASSQSSPGGGALGLEDNQGGRRSTSARLRAHLFCLPRLSQRVAHLLVVVANALQLLLMIAFLSLLLARLDGHLSCGYSLIFVPLWVSDAITCVTGLSETARVLRAPSDSPKRNALINQVNRLKGCVCVAAFKALVALRLDGTWPSTPVYVLCSPYYAAAVLRLALHFCKRPLEAAPRRTACGKLLRPRPGWRLPTSSPSQPSLPPPCLLSLPPPPCLLPASSLPPPCPPCPPCPPSS